MGLRLGACIGFSLLFGACATVTQGTTDTVKLESTPAGAKATASDMTGDRKEKSCVTNCTLELNRKATWKILFQLAGYEDAEVTVRPELSGEGMAGMAGNVLIGGIIGAGVDAATGAMMDLKPNPVQVTLTPIGAAPTPAQQAPAGDGPAAQPSSGPGTMAPVPDDAPPPQT